MATQGIVVGLGCGCLFVPSVAILPSYFSKRKSLAMGIGASRSSLDEAETVYRRHYLPCNFSETPATNRLSLDDASHSFYHAGHLSTSFGPNEDATEALFSMGAHRPWCLARASLPTFWYWPILHIYGTLCSIFYVQTYVIQQGIMSENLGFYLLAILNAGSLFGRIILNHLADKVGPLNVCIACGISTDLRGLVSKSQLASSSSVYCTGMLCNFIQVFFPSTPLHMNTRFSWSTEVPYENQVLLGLSGFTSSSRCRDPFPASRSDWSPPWDVIFANQFRAADR
ncbi:MFS monocarboxylate transporter protein [Rutstroemia sp. NJR-2017a WRK4]|nr:MFS monocarboxylate transporter protein [Rutstroemia sp. NJR-2017a WRK4]